MHGAAKAFGNSFKESSGTLDAWNQDSSGYENTRKPSIANESEDTMLSLYATKEIDVVTKSWIERIHNKYGFSTVSNDNASEP